MAVLAYPLLALVQILDSLLFVYSLIILAAVVVSWVGADPFNPIVRALKSFTEPVFHYVRTTLPALKKIQAVDLSPLIVWVFITFIRSGILPIIAEARNSLLQ